MSLPGSSPPPPPAPGAPSAPAPSAVELLDRAVGYTRGCLAQVTPRSLDRPTPCAGWTLLDLLRHMDDSLAALAEAAQTSSLSLAAAPGPDDAAALLASIRHRACTLLGHWLPPGAPTVSFGPAELARETVGAVGALEITLHGWDVATSLGLDRPIPPTLAMDLWPWARDHITDADRPDRFGPPAEVSRWAPPDVLLLARAGRRGPTS